MANDTIVLPEATRSVTGRSLLFPVTPAAGETLPGYLLRNVEPNCLPSIRPILSLADLDIELAGNCLGKLSQAAPRLAAAFPVPSTAWSAVWGVEPEQAGRRRLGGVWLKPELIESNVRRVPRGHRPGEPDQAIWMVRHLGFCDRTWEMLTDRCPPQGCGRSLTWYSARALHLCGHCGASVSLSRRQSVPAPWRPTLRWLLSLFDEDENRVARAMTLLPAVLNIESPTEAYELILAMARPLRAFANASLHGRVTPELGDLVRACRFILDFPRSHWDLAQHGPSGLTSFRSRMDVLVRQPHGPAVRNDLRMFQQYGRPVRSNVQPSGRIGEWLSTTQAAAHLNIQRRDVRRLVEAGLLLDLSHTDTPRRTHSSFRSRHVERLRDELRGQVSLRELSTRTGLRRIAVEQLLACGLLKVTTSSAAKLVFEGLHTTRESADALSELVYAKSSELSGSEYVPLRCVMRGVGGRPKPWGRLIQAILNDDVPGGLAGSKDRPLVDLAVHPIVARELIMGGPGGGQLYAFQVGDLAGWEREEMCPREVEEHLNCTAQDVSWLKATKRLSSLCAEGSRTRYVRREVEALGFRLITTREIAARRGLKPAQVWPELQPFSEGGAFGQGFYDRTLVEGWLKTQ